MEKEEIQRILIEEFSTRKNINNINDWRAVTNSLINSFSSIDLLQYHIDNPNINKLERIDQDHLIENQFNQRGGVCEINAAISEKIVTGIYEISISNFYPVIIKQLITSNILNTDENFNKAFLTVFDYYRNHTGWEIRYGDSLYSDDFRLFYRTWLNWTSATLSNPICRPSRRFNNDTMITMYSRYIFNQIVREFNWVYLDTDTIFCYMDTDTNLKQIFDKYQLTFHTKPIQYAYFKSKKRYFCIGSELDLTYRGIKVGEESDAENEIHMMKRDKTIYEILN
jgi:hypothetical protein